MKKIFFTILIIFLTGCSNINKTKNIETSEKHFIDSDIYDPLEPLNRRIYYFNAVIDRNIILPTAKFYSKITPDFLEKGISNFFNNLNEIPTILNSTLQFKFDKAFVSSERFLINSTIGFLGFFDISSNSFNLEKHKEDFGQTLAFYHIPQGPYIILPILGPSTVRDTVGTTFEYISKPYTDPLQLIDYSQSTPEMIFISSINKRNNLNFRYYQSASPFEYDYIRFLYFKTRQFENIK
ncbi:phospholipid-binding lipoprotein MlaA [Hypnocyclicus thermotrophus]|uniref:Phospholipid-binding lipoprotein MlaA n=1 Tax=Hypnocyclicus thermotrophus TaxID=1627895 RepID=A0AA46DYD6_9FUSO|nr:VacJ family lipoprotein [Hypnocyclicus thermotrophus]TDT69784.1 phospholipid-binding lipoprotein MlaA [Hypnocyclicus thermotrophus]